MKRTIISLFALTGAAIAEDSVSISLHDVVFSAPSAQALHNAFTTSEEAAAANLYLTGKTYYTNTDKGTKYHGIYLDDSAGLKFNHSDEVTVDCLYLGSSIKMKTGTSNTTGQLNWTSGGGITISANSGSWVDINADYGSNINVASMTSGALYLNSAGALTLNSAISEKVTVYATITEAADARTLLAADFSDWNGNVVLQNADGTAYTSGAYSWKASSEGLQIVSIPEPATATLSLLALAGLAARRRRK